MNNRTAIEPAAETGVMTLARPSFKARMREVREDAIVQTVIRLLSEKGFESMTVDEVAAAVGIAKASLYKHFPSKEHLAAAAMVRLMERACRFVAEVPLELAPLERLRHVAQWTIELQLAGEMPSLPSENSTLRAALINDRAYMDGLMTLSETLGQWITKAQADGQINPRLPAEAVLYTLYARACDPVLGFLQAGGAHDNAQIVQIVLSTCFDGISAR